MPSKMPSSKNKPHNNKSTTKATGKFEVLLASPIPTLRLADTKGDNAIELRLTHPQSSILQITHNGKIFLGNSFWNPGLYDASGNCLQQRTAGVPMSFLLSLFLGGSAMQELTSRESWKAWFEIRAASDTTLCLRLHFSNPFADTTPRLFFEQDVEFHQFMQ